MAYNFQIPNAGGYLPQMQQQPDSADTSQQDELTYLLNAFKQRLEAEAPTPPPTPDVNLFHAMFMNRLGGPLQQMLLQRMMEKQPEYEGYSQRAAGYEAGQKQLGDIRGMVGALQSGANAQGVQQRFDKRMAVNRFETRTLSGQDASGANVDYRFLYDNELDVYIDPNTGQQVDVSRLTPKAHVGMYPGPGNVPQFYSTSEQPTTPQVPRPLAAPPITQPTPAVAPGAPPQPGAAQASTPSNVRPRTTLQPKQPPQGVTQDVARASAFVQALAPVYNDWLTAKKQVSGVTGEGFFGTLGQMAADRAAGSKGTRALLPFAIGHTQAQTAIDYKQRQKISLYNYVKQQTGAQFALAELDRYESMFPALEDTEQTAINSLTNLANKAVADINALKVNWHAIQTPGGIMYIKPEYMAEFLRTGGMPQEQPQAADDAEAIYQEHMQKKQGKGQAGGQPRQR